MNLQRRVGKLNDILGSTLGRNIYGEPLYKWCWSEDLLHPMAVIEQVGDEFHPVLDYHADPETGLIKAEQKFVLRKECPGLENQWVLCKWLPPLDPYEWRKIFGHSLEWKSRGDYAPISAPGDGNYASLPPGEDPTESTTQQAIGVIAKARLVNQKDEDYKLSQAIERQETNLKSQIMAEIRELGMIANRPYLPGRGDKDYSFGGVN